MSNRSSSSMPVIFMDKEFAELDFGKGEPFFLGGEEDGLRYPEGNSKPRSEESED